MAIKILLILLFLSIEVFAQTEGRKRYSDYILTDMEKQCKYLEKERSAKKHKVDVVPDSISAVAMAFDIAYSKYDATPTAKTGVRTWLIGEYEEYWMIQITRLMRDYNKVVFFKL